jgi:hypothetical protein
MSGGQSFHRRVTLPAFVILATVSALFFGGYKLWKMDSVQVADQPSVSSSPTESMPTDLPSESAEPTMVAGGRLPVIVLNGTDAPGLAKSTSDALHNADWAVEETGNWTGEPLLETTIFYPAGGLSSAEELAAQTGGTSVEATADMSQTALTLVVIK